ncbi:S16 family serine protease [Zhihengliuella sp.]|uniref:YlbL family protein n=1 Tax=Zhihengliuella sp. TaxID=1954483 RepID=UPI002811EC19|nr:S16 family serine protease [Zhihengliuella sp.]
MHQGAPTQHARQAPGQQRRGRTLTAATAIGVGLAFVAMLLPAPYVVEAPGPVVNTVGEAQGEPVLSVGGHRSYPTSGRLDLTTVYVRGGAGRQISFFDTLVAWTSGDQDVFPAESVYPRGVTGEEVSEQNTAAMDDSQETAVAAALGELGIDYASEISVVDFASDLNSDVLEEGDVVLAVNGGAVTTAQDVRDALQEAESSTLRIRRGGEELDVEVDSEEVDGARRVGIYLRTEYDFPFEVRFGLEDIGGPSAGMMFALGVVELLTPGQLPGDTHVAGTGTVTAGGMIGPIGGIAQKAVGAREAGAEVFLAPAGNCADLEGRVPEGLDVVRVETLADAYDAVAHLGGGGAAGDLPTC